MRAEASHKAALCDCTGSSSGRNSMDLEPELQQNLLRLPEAVQEDNGLK
jgi:hypothetical protein